MRKSSKFLWICAILAGIGFLLAGIGIAMGGIIHGIQINPQGIQVYAPLLAKDSKEDRFVEKEETLEAFHSIQVDMEYADIRVERADTDVYALSYNVSNSQELQKEVKDGKLMIKHSSQGILGNNQMNINWFFIGTSSMGTSGKEMVTIRLPKDAELSEVLLHTESGDTVCENIQADSLHITAEYGNVSLFHVKAQEIAADMESGKLQMEQVQGDSCSVRNEYGSLSFYDLAMASNLTVEMESGDARFRDTDIQNLDLESSYGDVTGQQAAFKNLKMVLESGDCEFQDILFDDCEIHSSYGNVELELKKDVSEYGYQLHTEYGDIEIGGEEMGESYSSLGEKQERRIGIKCESGDIRIQ